MAKSIGIAIILIATVIVAVKCSSSRTEEMDRVLEDHPTKNEAIKRPFRFGRSDYYGSKQLNIAPRNDRFFIGSRYGKRSQEFATNNFLNQLEPSASDYVPLVCAYTGFADLYRCKNAPSGLHEAASEDRTTED